MKIDDRLSDIFDVPKLPEKTGEVIDAATGEIIESTDSKIDSDYDKSRSNLHDLLSKGHEALAHALEVAKQSEHPRAFEVLSGLMKNLADMNKDLLEIQKRKKDLAPKAEAQNNLSIDKAVFVGSTAELVKMLKTQKQET